MTQEHQIDRKRTLTAADIEELKKVLATHDKCTLGLTSDEVSTLKRILSAFDAAASTIGKTILVAIIGTFLAMLTKGFWAGIIEGIKNGSS